MTSGQLRPLAGVLGALSLLSSSLALAADPAAPAKPPAAPKASALAKFKRTYEILPNPVVLYNIGLVYAAMARPVDAVDSLDPAISSGGLSPKQLERAQQTLADQKARVGRLTVTTTPEGARVEVD